MKRLALCLAILACGFTPARGDVRLHGLFTDHIILQRDMPAPVWGWADPGERVIVRFAGQDVPATADKEGRPSICGSLPNVFSTSLRSNGSTASYLGAETSPALELV